ncbi:hypothetical protein [Sediminivirga luteola]|uniref:Uncharacterized protein n=1 Tax=Sediminivirga luteola TaxID=1774748 RepID=A0A8J2XM93_9MICO|nr:hypothetical protein [Sediminivirga luteola]GGA29072.1 hypothetical protein GCM10011333_34610 [Sediminivirga luteola]
MTTPTPLPPTTLNTIAGLIHAWHHHRETEARIYAHLRELVDAVETSMDIDGPPPGGCNSLSEDLVNLRSLEPGEVDQMLENLSNGANCQISGDS